MFAIAVLLLSWLGRTFNPAPSEPPPDSVSFDHHVPHWQPLSPGRSVCQPSGPRAPARLMNEENSFCHAIKAIEGLNLEDMVETPGCLEPRRVRLRRSNRRKYHSARRFYL